MSHSTPLIQSNTIQIQNKIKNNNSAKMENVG